MDTQTFLWLFLAVIVALGMAFFHYFFKRKEKGPKIYILAILRFLGIFGLLALLINPKFVDVTYTLEKPNLVLLVDNSTSVSRSGADLKTMVGAFQNNKSLQDRFQISTYGFGEQMRPLDSVDLQDKETNIQEALTMASEIFSKEKTVLALITDGNQTIGTDYGFNQMPSNFSVFPIAVGDTTSHEDLAIGPINTNTYAFLNNSYPLESFVLYNGTKDITAKVRISVNGKTVFSEPIKLNKGNNLKAIKTVLPANSVGLKNLMVSVDELRSERNIANNARQASVEVIDEKTQIGIVSNLVHPDLGALKKALESNEQRQVSIIPPTAPKEEWGQMDLLVLYQPNAAFRNMLPDLNTLGINTLTIAGTKTDFAFLNRSQQNYEVGLGYPEQEILGSPNKGFARFDISDFDMTDFPPLQSNTGPVTFKASYETLVEASIRGLAMEWPLMALMEDDQKKHALLFGENIWKWRMQAYRNTGNFAGFDDFMGKLVRYMGMGNKKDRLNISYNRIFEGSNKAVVKATYFDGAYEFDPNAHLSIAVTDTKTQNKVERPMVLKNGYFEADLTTFPPGSYAFSVTVAQENMAQSGHFSISDFDMEKQFVSTDKDKLGQLAERNGGKLYYADSFSGLLEGLKTNDVYLPTRKGQENIVSLRDYKIVMALIVLAFALEWFIRKYNGLI